MKPNLVLVAVVLVTAVFGFLPGVVWAFVAGLTANLLVPQPLGIIPLSMLAVAALVAGGGRLLGRLSWIYPVLAALAGSLVADVLGLGIFRLVAEAGATPLPFELMARAAVLNAALAAALVYPVRVLAVRVAPEERAAW